MSRVFYKMQATGNDFVFIVSPDKNLRLAGEDVRHWCDRQRGIGADGVVVLQPDHDDHFEWVFYNSDGGEVEMCGNAARCATRLASELFSKSKITVQTRAGIFQGDATNDVVTVSLAAPQTDLREISLPCGGLFPRGYLTNTGVPHCVIPVSDPHGMKSRTAELAPFIFAKEFQPAGANLTFVNTEGEGPWQAVTLERGVNDFTLSCGTGVIAAAQAVAHLHRKEGWLEFITPGGSLAVYWKPSTGRVQLRGPAEIVFRGEI